jgi:hypothetical protein
LVGYATQIEGQRRAEYVCYENEPGRAIRSQVAHQRRGAADRGEHRQAAGAVAPRRAGCPTNLGSVDPIFPLQFIELDQPFLDRLNLLTHKVGQFSGIFGKSAP